MISNTTLYDLIERAVEKAIAKLHDKMRLGKGDTAKTLFVAGRANFVWARDITGSNALLQVRCTKITPAYGLEVYVKRGLDGVVEVAGQDDQSAEKFWGGKVVGNGGAHALAHGYFGTDPILLVGRQFVPFLCQANDPADLTVRVHPCIFWNTDGSATAFAGGNLDLSSYVPSSANQQRIVIVARDKTTNTLTAIAGTPKTVASTDVTRVPFSDAEAAAIALGSNHVPSMAVRLYNGQTVINIHDTFLDMRQYYTMPWEGGSGSGAESGGESGDDLHAGFFGGRLTPVSGTPVPTTDQTAVTTIYCTPTDKDGHALDVGYAKLWDTTLGDWMTHQWSEISASVPATTDTLYDIFFYFDGAAYQLQFVAWTNDTTRATALGDQDGIQVMASDHSKLFIGMVRTTSVSGQTEDSKSTQNGKRYIVNRYNQVRRSLYIYDSTNFWSTSNTSYENLNTSANNRCNFLVCDGGKELSAELRFDCSGGANGSVYGYLGIGLDSTTNSAQMFQSGGGGTSVRATLSTEYKAKIPEGARYLQVLQRASGGTFFFLGSLDGSSTKSAGMGYVWG